MIQQAVITDWKAEMAKREQHSKVSLALLQKTSKLQQALMVYALRTRRKQFYERLKGLMTHVYTLYAKVPFDCISEITHRQALLALDEVTALENMHTTYTATDLHEMKTLMEEYRATLGKPRMLTTKQQEKVNLALKDLEAWNGFVPEESGPLPPPVVPTPPVDWQAVFAKRRKNTEVKGELLKRISKLISPLGFYAMKTGKNEFYKQISTLTMHAHSLYLNGPFEKVCEIVLEQASLSLDGVTAMETPLGKYTAADVQEFKAFLEQYDPALWQVKKPTPKQQVKIDKVVKDLEGWRI